MTITHHTHWQFTDDGRDSYWMNRAFDEEYGEPLKSTTRNTVVFRTLEDAQAFARRVLERYCATSPPCGGIPSSIKGKAMHELGLPPWSSGSDFRSEVRVVGEPLYGTTEHEQVSVTRLYEVRFGRTRTTVKTVEVDGDSYTTTSDEWSSWYPVPDPEVITVYVSKVVTTVIG